MFRYIIGSIKKVYKEDLKNALILILHNILYFFFLIFSILTAYSVTAVVLVFLIFNKKNK